MQRALLLLVLLLPGCGLFLPAKPVVFTPIVIDCPYFITLAGVVVDRRRLGQSRAEQNVIVDRGPEPRDLHLSLVDAVYDWPRPTTAQGWAALRATAVAAARLHCSDLSGGGVDGVPGDGAFNRPFVLARPPLTSK